MLLCQLHEQRGEAEALVSTLVALSSLHLMVGEADGGSSPVWRGRWTTRRRSCPPTCRCVPR